MSAKIRLGGPIDEPEDLDGPHWAGQVPIRCTWDAAGAVGRPPARHRRARRHRRRSPVNPCDATQPGRPVGRPPRRPDARAVHRQPGCARRRRPVASCATTAARRCGSRASCGSRTGATRSTHRTCGRRCSSSTTPSPSPPGTGRARRAAGPTTSPTATPSTTVADGGRRRSSSTGAWRPSGCAAVAGLSRAADRPLWDADVDDLPVGTVVVIDGTPHLVGRGDAAAVLVRRLGPGPSTAAAGRAGRRASTPPTSVAAPSAGWASGPTLHRSRRTQPLAPPVKFHDARRSAGAVHHGIADEYVSPGMDADARADAEHVARHQRLGVGLGEAEVAQRAGDLAALDQPHPVAGQPGERPASADRAPGCTRSR